MRMIPSGWRPSCRTYGRCSTRPGTRSTARDVATFLAWRGREPVGRVAAVVNRSHNEFHHDRTGFFGLFESIDDQGVADALLAAAEAWLAERGMTSAQGPMNLSTNEEICSPGVLIEGSTARRSS
jgi:GNAT superfamily N-acetyltransferase